MKYLVRWGAALACALCIALLGVAGASAADAQPSVFGKNLLQTTDLPADALARFVRHDAELKAKGLKPSFNNGSQDWAGTALPLPSSGNPYRVVVRVAGTVVADGDTGSYWMAGWNEDGQARSGAVTGTTSQQRKAGERVEFAGAAAPLSFKSDRNLQPTVMFLGSSNLQIDRVTVEVWSGVGKSGFVERVWAWSPLLLGVVFLAVFFLMRR